MKAFKYTVADSESAAAKLLGEGSLALAGGTNLVNLLKERVVEPDVIVDIKRIPGLGGIERADAGLRIGANVTLAEILADPYIDASYPALSRALRDVGTPQVRNRSTLGGNLTARPSCWYFAQEGFDCLKKGGSGCPAKEGENDFHAIFATDGPCVIVHASSAAPALIALGARVRISGPQGARELPLEELFALPSIDVRRETILKPNEIVTHVTLGAPNRHSATYEVRQKAGHDWPVSLASVALDMSFGVCRGARVVPGAVAPIPWRAPKAEVALAGKPITEEVAGYAADAAVEGAAPLAQNGYKVAATRAAVKRAVLLAGTGKWN